MLQNQWSESKRSSDSTLSRTTTVSTHCFFSLLCHLPPPSPPSPIAPAVGLRAAESDMRRMSSVLPAQVSPSSSVLSPITTSYPSNSTLLFQFGATVLFWIWNIGLIDSTNMWLGSCRYSRCTENDHPMMTRSKAVIYKQKNIPDKQIASPHITLTQSV